MRITSRMQNLKFILLFVVFLTFVESIRSATFSVSNINDSGIGSLRQAVLDANASPTDDVIDFQSDVFGRPQAIALSGGFLTIANSGALQINGTGATRLKIIGNSLTNVLFVQSGAVLTIQGVSVSNGASGNGEGGGISNFGTLTLNDCEVKENFATFQGGAIWNNGALTLNRTKLSRNSSGEGGGIYHQIGTVTINDSTIENNIGGGISSRAQVHINRSLISNNRGGGLYNFGGLLNLTNSTVAMNFRNSVGGGITSESGLVNLVNSTIAFNSATAGNGGGVYRGGGTINARNSLIAQNTGAGAPSDFGGVLTSQGFNLIGTTVFCTITGDLTGNLLNVDPRLSPLTSNGGASESFALNADSPAIDAADGANVLSTDQRGVARAVDGDGNGSGLPDIGAIEAGFLVSNTNDSGPGSLRQALTDSNSSSGNDEIRFSSMFDLPQTILLTGGELMVGSAGTVLLNGPGSDKLTISGNLMGRVLSISSGGNAQLRRLKLSSGRTEKGSGGAIAIQTNASVVLEESEISGNFAAHGGGIFNAGVLSVNRSVIAANTALSGDGGGIQNLNGIISVLNSAVRTNSAFNGGGIRNSGSLNLSNSIVEDNTGQGEGGGISHFSGTATVDGAL